MTEPIEQITEALIEAATEPSSMSHGGKSVSMPSLGDLSAARRELRQAALDDAADNAAANDAGFGIRMSKIIPPGAG